MQFDDSLIASAPISQKAANWSIADSSATYRLSDWGKPYFKILEDGNVAALLGEDPDASALPVSLMDVIHELKHRDISLPAIIRFPDMLTNQVRNLNRAFDSAIRETNYEGSFSGCFPIKVNQKREVIHEIALLSTPHQFGFEAGTKAELLIAITEAQNSEAFIICNGYKDQNFVDLALYATKAGLKVVLVIERTKELEIILSRSEALGIRPILAVRARIATKGAGRWSSTSGWQGLFGLTALELIRTLEYLKQAEMLDCLKMLHFHQGSQIPDLATVRRGIEEAVALYTQIRAAGAPLEVIDIGGGLAIDYEGSGIASHSSMNYSLDEYCQTVVEAIAQGLDAHGYPHPCIISESGRAIASHHSVLVFDVFGAAASQRSRPYQPKKDDPEILQDLYQIVSEVTPENALEKRRLAETWLNQCHDLFRVGKFNLNHLAAAQRLCSCITDRIRDISTGDAPISPSLRQHLSEYYYANFSVFRSIPDAWAIGQLFPVMPIHRLNEQPYHTAVIADITCDCDGKIRHYIGAHDESEDLPVHSLRPGEPYYMGVFLVGAYQETLGDIHNLLGIPAVVSVRATEGKMSFECVNQGDSVADVLQQVDYDRASLIEEFSKKSNQALTRSAITAEERNSMIRLFDQILDSSTYLDLRNP